MDMKNVKISGNFIEVPMPHLLQLVTDFLKTFTPDEALKVKVLFMQSGDTLHVYTKPDDEN